MLLGATLAILVLVLAGESTEGGAHRAFAYAVVQQILVFVLQPGMMTALLSGILMSATGPWGFVSTRWMVGKLALTAILMVHLQLSFRPKTQTLIDMAQQSTQGPLPAGHGDLLSFYLKVVVIQVLVLGVLAALGILKPGGRTRLGSARRSLPAETP